MRTVILYGELAKRFGKYHSYAIRTPAEAIRALKANFRGFEAFMSGAHRDGIGFRLFVGGGSIKELPEIHNPSGTREIIRIVPVLMGSGGSFGKILIGAALIGASILTGGAAGIAAGALGAFGATLASSVGMIGVGLVIGGVSQLLTSAPQVPAAQDQTKKKTSYMFSGPENVAAQGEAVPIGYGRMIIGSKVISTGIEVVDE